MPLPVASIIIACRDIDDLTRQCIAACLAQTSVRFEILVLPDEAADAPTASPYTRIVPTGRVRPAAKRNQGVRLARGSVFAFIDSDATPVDGWLANACRHLRSDDAGCVGGPNVTPPGDSYLEKASGDVYSTYLATGPFNIRYRAAAATDAPELPSCNLIVKRGTFERVGGFDEGILTGEDAKLCFQIRAIGQRVLYRPDVAVHHHRRALFGPHARQVWQYALDKSTVYQLVGGLKRFYYWQPTVLVAALSLCLAGLLLPATRVWCASLLLLYVVACFGEAALRSPRRSPVVGVGILVTHFAYGVGFLVGHLRGRRSSP